jgi:hypothetical protein
MCKTKQADLFIVQPVINLSIELINESNSTTLPRIDSRLKVYDKGIEVSLITVVIIVVSLTSDFVNY